MDDTRKAELPPHELEAEVAVLGSMLLDPMAATVCAAALRPEDFYRDGHGQVFKAICSLSGKAVTADPTLLREELLRTGTLERVGGTNFISRIVASVPSAANAEHYAAIVRDRARRRDLITAAHRIEHLAIEPEERSTAEVVAESRAVLDEIRGEESQRQSMADVLNEMIASLDQSSAAGRSVSSGFESFDQEFGRFAPGNLILLAARPSVGKTSLALQIALRAARYEQKRVLFFSIEMTKAEIARNLVCAAGGVNSMKLKPGRGMFLSEDDWLRVSTATSALSALQLVIDDTSALDPSAIRAGALRMQHEGGVDLVVIDYLQLIDTSPYRTKHTSTNDLVSWVSRKVKALAKELQCPIICLSQLNRESERQQRRPRLSDLRDSGSLEQDADQVLFIHREDMATTDPDAKLAARGDAELIVAKNRTGPLGNFPMRFDGPTFTFDMGTR